MAIFSITESAPVREPLPCHPKPIVEALQRATILWLRELFELPPEIVLLPGSGGSLQCPIARTLTASGISNVWVLKTMLRYSEPGGQRRTVLFSSQVKRWVAKFDEGLIPEFMDQSQRPVVYTTV